MLSTGLHFASESTVDHRPGLLAIGNSTCADVSGAAAPRTLGCADFEFVALSDGALGAGAGLLTGLQTSLMGMFYPLKKAPAAQAGGCW
jgi:hypothetical protein